MANLFTVPAGKLNTFTGKLSQEGLTAEIVLATDKYPEIVRVMVEAGRKAFEARDQNPFVMTLEEQLEALRLANMEEGWGIADEIIDQLAATAPAWPKGRDSYRSFRIRFGEGGDGVAQTFEAHMTRIERLYGKEKFQRHTYLRSGKEYLRRHAPDRPHTPVVEWCITSLDANEKMKSVKARRGPKSLADEGLVLAWLFPKRVEAIDRSMWPAWFCAGYEICVPEFCPQGFVPTWNNLICVTRIQNGEILLKIDQQDCALKGYSVPAVEG
ncbi:MAG: hypothetical protein QY323_00475 [Patescibacteria group bacterium]|nr:MAG: hypothetical protein QY323_00475 [Patescibacteria group bacterium]